MSWALNRSLSSFTSNKKYHQGWLLWRVDLFSLSIFYFLFFPVELIASFHNSVLLWSFQTQLFSVLAWAFILLWSRAAGDRFFPRFSVLTHFLTSVGDKQHFLPVWTEPVASGARQHNSALVLACWETTPVYRQLLVAIRDSHWGLQNRPECVLLFLLITKWSKRRELCQWWVERRIWYFDVFEREHRSGFWRMDVIGWSWGTYCFCTVNFFHFYFFFSKIFGQA